MIKNLLKHAKSVALLSQFDKIAPICLTDPKKMPGTPAKLRFESKRVRKFDPKTL